MMRGWERNEGTETGCAKEGGASLGARKVERMCC